MTVAIREVDKSNWLACTQLQVSEQQKANFPVPVGFLVYGIDPDDGEYWLLALLIDQKYQRQGLARATIQELIRHLQSNYGCKKLTLGHRPPITVKLRHFMYRLVSMRLAEQNRN